MWCKISKKYESVQTKHSQNMMACSAAIYMCILVLMSVVWSQMEHLCYEARLRAGTVHPGEEKAKGDICMHVVSWWGIKKAEPDSAHYPLSGQARGIGHKVKCRKVFLKVI